jgi:hypothetical protein
MKAARRLGASIALAAGCVVAAADAQAPACPAPNAWPAKIRIEYDVTASRGPLSISGESVLVFGRAGDDYTINVETDSAGLYHARQTSRGRIEANGLRPNEFVESRGRRAPATTTFDWGAGTVAFSVAPDSPATTVPGLQDRVSQLLQLAWLRRAAADAGSYEIAVAGARRVFMTRFVTAGTEAVKVPVGTVEAVRLERESKDDDKIEAWFGPAWCGLPVRIRYVDRKGGTVDHRMRSARIE